MEDKKIIIPSSVSTKLSLTVVPGHFLMPHGHCDYYVDVTEIKTNQRLAKEAGRFFGDLYANTPIDTVFCMNGTETIGAYLADELAHHGVRSISPGTDIMVVTPEVNNSGQMFLRDNVQKAVKDKKVCILFSSISTGETVDNAIDVINYYGGWVNALAGLFRGIDMVKDLKVDAIVRHDELPGGYHTYQPADCPLCQAGEKIDAIVNEYGYSKL